MIFVFVCVLGLCLGSFINALVWRLREVKNIKQKAATTKQNAQHALDKLSITKGRSMCTHCGHQLAAKDLVPVLSWVYLQGKCRYCKKTIEDTPTAELLGLSLFGVSYLVWPYEFTAVGVGLFVLWLAASVCMIALAVYDARWYELPTKLILPLTVLALVFAGLLVQQHGASLHDVLTVLGGVLALWGLFRLLYAISNGAWIGFGDVRLAVPLALLAGSPVQVMLLLFVASLVGTLAAVPLLIRGTKNTKAQLPFGPYLIAGCIVSVLWGEALISWLETGIF